jgi:hypothetical protein
MKQKLQAAQDKVNRNAAPWIGGMAVLVSLLSFLGAFLFTEVTAAPKTYQTIMQHQRDVDRQDLEQRELERKIDDGFNKVIDKMIDLHK